MLTSILIFALVALVVLFVIRWAIGALGLGASGNLIYVIAVVLIIIAFCAQSGLLTRF